MYERNAIIIDRYFGNLFGYDKSYNVKVNSNNYFELVDKLSEYQEISEKENNVMVEFEKIANEIRETQKLQDVFNKRNLKYIESRQELFNNLDEDADKLKKHFDKIEDDISRNDNEIKNNTEKFVEEVKIFQEKSEIRNECGKERRNIETEYNKCANLTIDSFNKLEKDKLNEIKEFINLENKNDIKENIKEKILKNGSKEKIPFDENVIDAAIEISTEIEEKKAEILLFLYDKTMRLLNEIKNDAIKIERHKKIVKDAKSRLNFLNVMNEYVILFLDNERMNTIGGQEEHKKIMEEACTHLKEDLIEIRNLYSLLLKEISGKASKKTYKELYNIGYLSDMQDDERKFEKSISKLNMVGTVIYPNYWRVEGMQKIFETIKQILTENYDKDLSEYEPLDITCDVNEDILKIDEINDTSDDETDDTSDQSEINYTPNNHEIDSTIGENETNSDSDNDEIDGMSSEEKIGGINFENTSNNQNKYENIDIDSDAENKDNNKNEDKNNGISQNDNKNAINISEIPEDDDNDLDDKEFSFEWDEEDNDDFENDEFENEIIDTDDVDSEDDEDEDVKRDKEIDHILGFFDEPEDDDEYETEEAILQYEDSDEIDDAENEFDIEKSVEDYTEKVQDDEEIQTKKPKKNKSIFGRKRK